MSQSGCRLCEVAAKKVSQCAQMNRHWIAFMIVSLIFTMVVFLGVIFLGHTAIGRYLFGPAFVICPITGTFSLIAIFAFYLPDNAISFNRFWYVDGEHRAHIHLRKPEYVKGRGRIDHRDQYISGWILQIPFAGWIRRCRILARPNKFFRVVWGRKDRVRVEDQHGNQIMLYPATLIRLMKRHHHVDDMVLNDQLDILSKHSEVMQRLTMLGRAIARELIFIDTMPATMGRSRHAQKIRDDLRNILREHFTEAERDQLKEKTEPVSPEEAAARFDQTVVPHV